MHQRSKSDYNIINNLPLSNHNFREDDQYKSSQEILNKEVFTPKYKQQSAFEKFNQDVLGGKGNSNMKLKNEYQKSSVQPSSTQPRITSQSNIFMDKTKQISSDSQNIDEQIIYSPNRKNLLQKLDTTNSDKRKQNRNFSDLFGIDTRPQTSNARNKNEFLYKANHFDKELQTQSQQIQNPYIINRFSQQVDNHANYQNPVLLNRFSQQVELSQMKIDSKLGDKQKKKQFDIIEVPDDFDEVQFRKECIKSNVHIDKIKLNYDMLSNQSKGVVVEMRYMKDDDMEQLQKILGSNMKEKPVLQKAQKKQQQQYNAQFQKLKNLESSHGLVIGNSKIGKMNETFKQQFTEQKNTPIQNSTKKNFDNENYWYSSLKQLDNLKYSNSLKEKRPGNYYKLWQNGNQQEYQGKQKFKNYIYN